MAAYDFKQLSPHDFEELSRDLIQMRDGIILESFKTGRDLGIDFRHARSTGSTIVQCKHYAGTGLAGLMADLKKEATKCAKLKPARYILVTSVGLTPSNKADIKALFGAVLATADILGPDDINNLLGLHPAIEQQHYKLWLASRVVLDRVIYNASLTQSEFDVERVHRDIRRYVRSDAYPRAFTMLNNDHVVIISGAPGVGKTSLAKMLLYAHLERGYEAVSILTDFQTGRDRYQLGKNQIFYFDDFIGATFLGERASAFTRNEDRAILDFIEMVRASPTARLVMTTREHILRQAITTSEKLKHSRLIDSRCTLEIGDYSQQQRAEILYNHIYFSDLPDDYRAELLTGRFYKEILQHKKFNPRLIEWLSSFQRVRSVLPDGYQSFVRDLLEDPAEIWRHAYEQQISNAARSVLLALYSYGGKCGPALLERSFRALHALRAQRYGFNTEPSDWRRALAELNGSFIRPGNQIEVIDPSVLDMLNAVVRQDTPNALDMIEGAVRFQQARRIWIFAHAEGSRDVLDHLVDQSACIATAFERLLSAPRKIPMGTGTAYIDDSPELRVGTVVQVAELLRSDQLQQVANSAVDALIAAWESEPVDISDGIELLAEIEASLIVFPPPNAALRARVVRALVMEASRGCRSDELHELLNVVEPEDLNDDLKERLYSAAEVYRARYFNDELRECKSESDYEALEEDLDAIAQGTGFSFDGPIYDIREAKAEFEEQKAAYEDHKYEEWKEQRFDIRADERALDDLFDSLRKPH
ncbi:MAG: restriction endonuclease [Gammaproteobacteria bacterium]|uniref:nSTAND3 domain-containing NTPase n=1 Tax=Thalassobaculum sp. TaxID=2022740 RepID=UPI0032EE562D